MFLAILKPILTTKIVYFRANIVMIGMKELKKQKSQFLKFISRKMANYTVRSIIKSIILLMLIQEIIYE